MKLELHPTDDDNGLQSIAQASPSYYIDASGRCRLNAATISLKNRIQKTQSFF